MFSKSRINEPGSKAADSDTQASPQPTAPKTSPSETVNTPSSQAKPAPSILSSDLKIKGNIRTSGDIQVEGEIEGDIHAHLLTVGEGATVNGEVVADDVIVNGRVIGRVRGLKVRLTSSARVEGDIIHKTIAIESGAHFEGSVQRQEDPLSGGSRPAAPKAAPAAAAAAPAPATAKA